MGETAEFSLSHVFDRISNTTTSAFLKMFPYSTSVTDGCIDPVWMNSSSSPCHEELIENVPQDRCYIMENNLLRPVPLLKGSRLHCIFLRPPRPLPKHKQSIQNTFWNKILRQWYIRRFKNNRS